jgi:hypothetical protein
VCTTQPPAARRPPGRQQALQRRHDGLQPRHVVAQAGAEAAGLDEVALHVDDHQRRARQRQCEGPGLGGDMEIHGYPQCPPM